MALSRTDFAVDSRVGNSAADYTTGAFSIPANSLVIVRVSVVTESGNPDNMAAGLTLSASRGGTPTIILRQDNALNTWGIGSIVSQHQDSAGGSTTFTVGALAGACHVVRVEVFTYTGFDTSTPIQQTKQKTSTGTGADSLTLDSAPASSSEVIGFLYSVMNAGSGSVTFGTGWTEIHDATTADWDNIQSQTRTGSTSTTVGWDDIVATGTTIETILQAIEVKAAAGGGGGGTPAPTLMLMGAGT